MRLLSKLFYTVILLISTVTVLTACANSKEDESSELLEDEKGNDSVKQEESQGRFIQTDITPPDIVNGEPIIFSQAKDGQYLLSIYDHDQKVPRAFTYQDGKWKEKNNDIVVTLIADIDSAEIVAFSDFLDNWWIFYKDKAGKEQGYKVSVDGSLKEIELPTAESFSYIGDFQICENGFLYLIICGELEDSGAQEYYHIFIDTKTGEIIENNLPSTGLNGKLVDDNLFTINNFGERLEKYDIETGKIIETFTLAKAPVGQSFYIDVTGDITFQDSLGIHRIRPNGSLVETVIDDKSFAYVIADNTILLVNKLNMNYLMACSVEDEFKVYEYSFNENLATNKSNKLTIWTWVDNHFLASVIPIFAEKYPEVQVEIEVFERKTGEPEIETGDRVMNFDLSDYEVVDPETARIFNEDSIKKMNTKLLAGEAPDVLILDGLSIDSLYTKGFLSEFDLGLDESLYYENILNSYATDTGVYAYPTFFSFPTVRNYGDSITSTQLNTMEKIGNLFPDSASMSQFDELNFDTFFKAYYFRIFPDNETVDEEVLREFLVEIKKMCLTNQNVNGKEVENEIYIDGWLAMGIQDFNNIDNLEFTPLFDGNFTNFFISSIPQDAKNKEMAKNFILTLLSDKVQEIGIPGIVPVNYSLKKNIRTMNIKNMREKEDFQKDIFEDYRINNEDLDRYQNYDWDTLVGSLNRSVDIDSISREIIYAQVYRYINDLIDIDTAMSEILDEMKMILDERR